MKVKLIYDRSPRGLEEEVNEFLAQNTNIKVSKILYSSCVDMGSPTSVLFSCMFFYEERKSRLKIDGEKKEMKINKHYEQ